MACHVGLCQLIDLLTTQHIHMGNNGVESQRIGIVQHAMIQRAIRGFRLADTTASQPSVPQRLRDEQRGRRIGSGLIISVGTGRAVRKFAKSATSRQIHSRAVAGLGSVDLVAGGGTIFLYGLERIIISQHGLDGFLQRNRSALFRRMSRGQTEQSAKAA